MEGIGLVAVLAIAWVLGWWAAHIRLTNDRIKVLRILTEARTILTKLESDKGRTLKLLQQAEATVDKANLYAAAEWVKPDESDRSTVSGSD